MLNQLDVITDPRVNRGELRSTHVSDQGEYAHNDIETVFADYESVALVKYATGGQVLLIHCTEMAVHQDRTASAQTRTTLRRLDNSLVHFLQSHGHNRWFHAYYSESLN